MSCDIVNYCLASSMDRPEFMKNRLRHIPIDIQQRYNIKSIATHDGIVFVRIEKGMYGLRNAAILAYNNVKTNLAKFGYTPVEGTVGI